MKVTLNWLKEYVDIRMEMKDLAALLTMAGLEVEETVFLGEGFDRVVVAEIHSIRRHPNADRLSLVVAETGRETLSIVCGASNIVDGQRVPLAQIGAKLPNGMEIRKSKIRGELSEGMLCSPIELGLGQDASGILILPPGTPVGADFAEVMGLRDTVIDVAITPNRADCLSVIGIAREIAALTGQKVNLPGTALAASAEEIGGRTSVTLVDPDLCPRYVARMIEGVKIGPSPSWLRSRLEKVGVRAINNVVDVTNYVMLEIGQPLHAFDYEFLEEGRIVVRRAAEGERFTTLDGTERTLDRQTLMICDGVKPVAIAGVMGGQNSEIRDETKTVLLESAYFNPMATRRTAARLGLETEAAYRFGRGVDPGGSLAAADRAAALICELAGGRIVEGAIDACPTPIPVPSIRIFPRKVNRILGTDIAPERMKEILEALDVKVDPGEDGTFVAAPPTYRRDLEREIDLVEEIARVEGYDRIPVTLPGGEASALEPNRVLKAERKAMEVLCHHGYSEVVTYSFAPASALAGLGLASDDRRARPVKILNPLTEDFCALRTSLVPGLLETARFNVFRKNLNLRIFELKKVFFPREGEKLPEETKLLAGLALGSVSEPGWAAPARGVDFFDAKGCVEDLADALLVEKIDFIRAGDVPYLHPGKAARITAGGEPLGLVGELHPNVLEHYELPGKAFLFEIDFERMLAAGGGRKRFKLLPKFPSVQRDLSMVVDDSLEAGRMTGEIWASRVAFIEEVTLFDVYLGSPVPEGKKVLSYRVRYQSGDRTLTDEEVNRCHEEIISRLKGTFSAELR